MKRILLTAFVAACSALALSCDVNDYCLNCSKGGDGGDNGDAGDGDAQDADPGDGGDGDAGTCVSQPEVCNNKDDDCDGQVDDDIPGFGGACDNTVGACGTGVKMCVNGGVRCSTQGPELCDGVDNDCDGVVDDGNPGGGAKCGTDQGECVAGTLTCQGGSVMCIGAVGGTMAPFGTAETCNGKDDDCDAKLDEMAPVPANACDANPDQGACNKGTPACVGGGVICVGVVGPSPELCDTAGVDQDCDGNPNNGYDLQNDPTNCNTCSNKCMFTNAIAGCRPNGMGGGECYLVTCESGYHNNDGMASNGCEFGPCQIQGNEVCNGVDDDCDGLTDMQDPDLFVPPVSSLCRTANECSTATVVCTGANGFRCNYPDPDVQQMNGVIQQETRCDTLDNDCDGAFDEGQPGLGGTCTRGQGECQTSGNLVCDTQNLNGPAVCNAANPGMGTPEACDGKDNNCNGIIDDGAATGDLPGQTWVTIPGSTVEMMKYEASHPDATLTAGGGITSHVCSRPDVLPWVNITYPQAVAACSSIGARLCTEAEWERSCLPDVAYPADATGVTTAVDSFRFIEAEAPFANTTIGGAARAWTPISPTSFNGVMAMQVPDNGFSVTNAANALAQSSRLDYQLNLLGGTNYRVWLRMRSPTPPTPALPTLGAHTPAAQTAAPMADATTQVGDLIIVTTYTTTTTGATLTHTLNGGFTQLTSQFANDGNNDARLSVAYMVATAAGAQTYAAYTVTGGTTWSGITVVRGNYDLGNIRSATGSDNSNAPPNPGAPGAVATNSLVLAIGAWNLTTASNNGVAPPSGYSEQWEMGISAPAELSVASSTANAGQNPDPGAFGDATDPANTAWATIAIGVPTNASRTVWVGLAAGTSAGAANATQLSTTTDNQWRWVVSPQLTSGAAGTHTFSIYTREDGVMIDTIAVARQATNSPTFDNAWAYETNPYMAQPLVCNGDEVDTAPPVAIAAAPAGATASGTTATFTTTVPHRLSVGVPVTVSGVANAAYNGSWTVLTTPSTTTFTATIATSGPGASGGGTANGDQDDVLATEWSDACHANHGAMDVFDMSGNVKEWTLARAAGQNPLRGGSANNAVTGLTCKLNFTLADNTFFFPNVGFRCCRD